MDRPETTLELMRTFARVAERGSLSAVARDLGIGQSTVSRRLNDLEEALGVRLLSRTTRRLNLTEEGARYYARSVRILDLVDQAADEARAARAGAAGRVRISCTAALGVLHIARLVFAFQDLYPDIEVDLRLSDERVDLVQSGMDLALRLGPVADSSMKLRRLGDSVRLMVAAPAFLSRRGRPATPEDLAGLPGVRMSNIAGSETLTLLDSDGRRHAVPFGGPLLVDHGLAAREALLAGRGFGAAHHWLVADLLADGRLEPILPGYRPEATPLSLLMAPARTDVSRVRLLADFLSDEIRRLPGIERPSR